MFRNVYIRQPASERGLPGCSVVKNPRLQLQEIWVWSPGWGDLLKEETATHSSILAWEIPSTEEPGGPQSTGLQRIRHDWAHTCTADVLIQMGGQSKTRLKMQAGDSVNRPWSMCLHLILCQLKRYYLICFSSGLLQSELQLRKTIFPGVFEISWEYLWKGEFVEISAFRGYLSLS